MNDTLPTSPLTDSNRNRATHDEISQRAQQLWETLGRPVGRDEEIWLQAEQELQTPTPAAQPFPTPPAAATPAPSTQPAPVKASASPRKPPSRASKAAAR